MAAASAIATPLSSTSSPASSQNAKIQQLLEFSGIFKGRELTRKDRQLACGIASLDHLLAGGIPRGRISEVTGPASSGKTTVAASFAAAASRRGEVVGWVDLPGAFDPRSVEAAGAELSRILWLCFAAAQQHSPRKQRARELQAAELLLAAGGFGLVVIDFGAMRYPLAHSSALRLAHGAERSGTAVLALAAHRVCGTFAALTLSLEKIRASFSRGSTQAPALFDGLRIEASVARNKLGVVGHRTELYAAMDPLAAPSPSATPLRGKPASILHVTRRITRNDRTARNTLRAGEAAARPFDGAAS